MILNILDKLVFGVMLLLVCQIPIVSDHYLQFINGYFEATKSQVEGYRETARRHEYENVDAMVNELLQDDNAVVRTDAEQKVRTIQEFKLLEEGVATLKEGNMLERAWYIFQPERAQSLQKVIANYKPGLPLSPLDILISAFIAMLLSMVLMWPIRWLAS